MKRVDEAHLQMLRDKKLSRKSDDILNDFELYEFSLKCAGPCPATGYLSYPKNKPSSSLPLIVHYDGYGAHSVEPFFDEGAIVLHSTHHGYPCGLSDEECYNELNRGILARYGRGNGHANANFDVKDDCYNLYIHLRNLQAIRFFINPEFSKDLPEVARLWNKKIELIGGSLGGYQSLGTAALLPFNQGGMGNLLSPNGRFKMFFQLFIAEKSFQNILS
jgi:cephalosporin-C deacetylase-like acetyl esterase